MRQKDENYMSMASATEKVLDNNQDLWSTNAPMVKNVANLKEDILLVHNAQMGGGAVSTGSTIDKETAGDNAITLAVNLAGFTQAYALDQNNYTLNDQVKVSFTSLDRLPDNVLSPELNRLFEVMNGLPDEAQAFGITPVALAAFKDAIDVFDNVKSNPRVIISERKGHNANIPALIREIRATFYKIDRLIKTWETSHPKFVSDYKNARIIIDLGIRHEAKPDAPTN